MPGRVPGGLTVRPCGRQWLNMRRPITEPGHLHNPCVSTMHAPAPSRRPHAPWHAAPHTSVNWPFPGSWRAGVASRTGVQVWRGLLGTHVHAEEGSRRRCGRGENRSGSGVCGEPCVAFRRTDRLIRCDALSVPARFPHGCSTRTGERGVRRLGGVPRRRGLGDIPSGCGHLVCTRCPVLHLRKLKDHTCSTS